MRKRRAVKRDVLPDPIYNSKVVTKLVNQIMLDGKKGTAQKILYEAFDIVAEKTGKRPPLVFRFYSCFLNRLETAEYPQRRHSGSTAVCLVKP